MGETEEKKTYEVLLPLEKYEALIEAKYQAREELVKAEASSDNYRDKYWSHKEKAERLEKALAEVKSQLASAVSETEIYKSYFAQNSSANMEYQMWLTENKGDDEA